MFMHFSPPLSKLYTPYFIFFYNCYPKFSFNLAKLDLLLFVLPSLHAHARMALSTRFDYVVAPKVACCLQRGPSSQGLLVQLPEAPLAKYEAIA